MSVVSEPPALTTAYLRSVWSELEPHLNPTVFVRNEALDEAVGCQVTLASEIFQRTGSFKYRAAYNLIRSIPNQRVVSASSGNFGQAVALACTLLGRSCTVVMPESSSKVKIEAVRRNGATADLIDTTRVSRQERVQQLLSAQEDAFYAPAYDETRVIAGSSTLGREIFQCGAEFDAVVVPVGGGGLISGIISAREALGSRVPIIGAEPQLANDASRSMQSGRLIANESEPATIADGARTLSLGEITWPIVQRGVERIVEAPDADIAEAVRMLFRFANVKAEPTGALSLAAAALDHEQLQGKRICCVISGGNVDEELYAAILRREI